MKNIIRINNNTTVKEIKDAFAKEFNLTLKVYDKNRIADDNVILETIKDTSKECGIVEVNEKWTIKTFADFMMEKFGLKVKVFTCDAWVAVLDGITIEDAGKIKKGAVIADMTHLLKNEETYKKEEKEMLATKRKEKLSFIEKNNQYLQKDII